MRIVFVTQRFDPADPILGATVAKIRALAERCDELVVLTDRLVPEALPANARARSFASGTQAGRGARFAAALAAELARRPRPDAVVAHMCPIYAVLAWPLVTPLRVPLGLWSTHWKRTRTLALAVRLVDWVASVDPRSVAVPTPKAVGIGHGIDVSEFTCPEVPRPGARSGSLALLALGRYSAAKGLTTTARAVAIARERGLDVRLRCHGTATTEGERADRAALEALVAELGLGDAVSVGDAVPRTEVPALLRSADVLVNNMRPTSPDKVVFEAAASGLPVIVSNPPFADLLGDLEPPLMFAREDAGELAARIAGVAALDPEARLALGRELADRVRRLHSVDSWADGILRLCAGGRAAA